MFFQNRRGIFNTFCAFFCCKQACGNENNCSNKKKASKKQKPEKFNYIIKIADFYFEDSAYNLMEELILVLNSLIMIQENIIVHLVGWTLVVV